MPKVTKRLDREAYDLLFADFVRQGMHKAVAAVYAHEEVVNYKRCPACGRVKHVDEFYRNRSTYDGLTYDCRPCRRAATAARAKTASLSTITTQEHTHV